MQREVEGRSGAFWRRRHETEFKARLYLQNCG
jgi:hypothetical protein